MKLFDVIFILRRRRCAAIMRGRRGRIPRDYGPGGHGLQANACPKIAKSSAGMGSESR